MLGRPRKEDYKLETSQAYTMRPYLKRWGREGEGRGKEEVRDTIFIFVYTASGLLLCSSKLRVIAE